jgi:hypothetical protein
MIHIRNTDKTTITTARSIVTTCHAKIYTGQCLSVLVVHEGALGAKLEAGI